MTHTHTHTHSRARTVSTRGLEFRAFSHLVGQAMLMASSKETLTYPTAANYSKREDKVQEIIRTKTKRRRMTFSSLFLVTFGWVW